jgi:apolipoprotein N-acyltransferase
VLLTAYCALYPFLWLVALRWIFPACRDAGAPARLLATLGLAGAWGLLEWLRTIALTGFGWLPLSASQQGNGVLLTLCAWVGPTGLSIGLVLINLGLASWIVRLRALRASADSLEPLTPTSWFQRLTPELYLGLAVIAAGFYCTLQQLAREARQACGCGGTVREREIELQGDNPPKVRAFFESAGFRVAGV